MPRLRWTGRPPSPALTRRLARDGFVLSPGRGAVDVEVVATPAARPVPQPPPAGPPWLWVSPSVIPPEAAREAAVRGAYDAICVCEPAGERRLCARLAELVADRAPLPDAPTFVAQSQAARHALAQVARVADSSMPVLVTGETGTGKEVTARLIHQWSHRRDKRFVSINCAAVPNDLMDAELFGYSKGAFSGAAQKFDGQLMAAEGGTVFLDEIDDTPLSTQVKLLRVLEDRVVQRLGEREPHRVDFRIVAATNRDLKPLIASGAFGADFYGRLAVVTIPLPPLRERLEDIPVLARHFIGRYYREEPSAGDRTRVDGIAPASMAALEAYPWPGNIRELRNVLFEALVHKRGGDELLLSDLPRRVLTRQPPSPNAAGARGPLVDEAALARQLDAGAFDLREEVEHLERAAVLAALARTGGNAAQAARLLGQVGRGAASDPGGTLRAMMKRLKIRRGRGR